MWSSSTSLVPLKLFSCVWFVKLSPCDLLIYRSQKTHSILNNSRLLPLSGHWLATRVHDCRVRAWILRTLHLFLFSFLLCALLIPFQTKQVLLLDTYSADTLFSWFPTVVRRELEEPQQSCQAPSVYGPGLESFSKRKHSWHPVQGRLALSNYLASCQILGLGHAASCLPPPWRKPGWSAATVPPPQWLLGVAVPHSPLPLKPCGFWLLVALMISYMAADAHNLHEVKPPSRVGLIVTDKEGYCQYTRSLTSSSSIILHPPGTYREYNC